MTTAQQIVDLARLPLEDEDKVRYSDALLLSYLNFGLQHLKRVRADMFIGSLKTGHATLTLASVVPTPEEADQAIADYVTARAGMTDNTEEDAGRAAAFFKLAGGAL
jgi:hypothetical protein